MRGAFYLNKEVPIVLVTSKKPIHDSLSGKLQIFAKEVGTLCLLQTCSSIAMSDGQTLEFCMRTTSHNFRI